MEKRTIPRLDREVSVVGLGTWQLGADWGDGRARPTRWPSSTRPSTPGVSFLDTADVYGDGRSERLVGRCAARARRRAPFVATKMGRRVEQLPENYTRENFLAWNDRSRGEPRRRHPRPGPAALPADGGLRRRRRVRRARRAGRATGAIARYGVSRRDRAHEALTAIARPAVAQRADHPQLLPAEAARARCCPPPREAGVGDHRPGAAGLRAAVGPLRRAHHASPPTTTATTTATARRSTSARPSPGVPLRGRARGASRELARAGRPRASTMAPVRAALDRSTSRRHDGIPGARNAEQARGNAAAADSRR